MFLMPFTAIAARMGAAGRETDIFGRRARQRVQRDPIPGAHQLHPDLRKGARTDCLN